MSCRCPFLRARLSAAWQHDSADGAGDGADGDGGSKGSVELTELHPAALDVALRWMYGGGCRVGADVAVELLRAADLLLLPELKEEAERVLVAMTDVASCVPLLIVADQCGLTALRARALDVATRCRRSLPPNALMSLSPTLQTEMGVTEPD